MDLSLVVVPLTHSRPLSPLARTVSSSHSGSHYLAFKSDLNMLSCHPLLPSLYQAHLLLCGYVRWPRDRNNCDSVNKYGSLCGGPTYFVSRGMLQGLMKVSPIASVRPRLRFADSSSLCLIVSNSISLHLPLV